MSPTMDFCSPKYNGILNLHFKAFPSATVGNSKRNIGKL